MDLLHGRLGKRPRGEQGSDFVVVYYKRRTDSLLSKKTPINDTFLSSIIRVNIQQKRANIQHLQP